MNGISSDGDTGCCIAYHNTVCATKGDYVAFAGIDPTDGCAAGTVDIDTIKCIS